MTTSTDTYRAWKALDDETFEANRHNAAAYLYWRVSNPSPMLKASAFSDDEPSRKQVVESAIESTLHRFRGERVTIDATDEPDSSSRYVWQTTGVVRGLGYLSAEGNGAKDVRTVVVEIDGEVLVTIRLARIMFIDSVR